MVGDLLRHGGLDMCNTFHTTLYGWVQAWSEAMAASAPAGQADDADFAGTSLYTGGQAARKRALGMPPAARISDAVALPARLSSPNNPEGVASGMSVIGGGIGGERDQNQAYDPFHSGSVAIIIGIGRSAGREGAGRRGVDAHALR